MRTKSLQAQPAVPVAASPFKRLALVVPLMTGALFLGACGNSTLDRGVSGAGIGAGTGAAIGAVFGGVGVVPGALIGAAVGGGAGALTSNQQVDLGDPVWRR